MATSFSADPPRGGFRCRFAAKFRQTTTNRAAGYSCDLRYDGNPAKPRRQGFRCGKSPPPPLIQQGIKRLIAQFDSSKVNHTPIL